MAININQLADEINKQLRQYADGVGEEVEETAKKVARMGAKKLKFAGNFKNQTGDYRKGWRAKKVDGVWIVHNATDYQLTHLLEKGHPTAKAFPHIKPVEEEMIDEYIKGVEEAIRK